MSGLAISLMMQVSLLSADAHGQSYSQAYRQMQSDGQPLLILVGADWCPGCVTMKRSVMPRLESAGKLGGVHFATVDVDADSDLAEQLMRGGTIPQLIVYSKTASGWHREQFTGAVHESSVEALIRRAEAAQQSARTAAAHRSVSESGGN